MEPSQYSLLEELLGPRRENWTKFPVNNDDHHHHHQLFRRGWSYEPCYESLDFTTSNSSLAEAVVTNSQVESPSFACSFNEIYPFVNGYSAAAEIDSSSSIKNNIDAHDPFAAAQDGNFGVFGNDVYNFEEMNSSSSKEQACLDIPVFDMGTSEDRRSKIRKVEGQPSKNLMAERRRRKRLNDRLSMLRSVVPKVSKMDRTSILGDTIDYMKELLEKIHKLQGKDHNEADSNIQINSMGTLKELNMKETTAKNSSKFDVERRDKSTRIEISCAEKPGLLLSTVNTIEALGLDIQQCVISCFNDFSLQASCSEAAEHRAVASCEDLKQALHINAGYGGRCL